MIQTIDHLSRRAHREFLLIRDNQDPIKANRGFHMGLLLINMEFLLRSMFRIRLS